MAGKYEAHVQLRDLGVHELVKGWPESAFPGPKASTRLCSQEQKKPLKMLARKGIDLHSSSGRFI